MIYLDHAATTPLHPEVRTAMAQAGEAFGNPSSLHRTGRQARAALEGAREQLAASVGCLPREVVFCSSGTEANHLALRGFVGGLPAGIAAHAVISSIEHPCLRAAVRELADTRPGFTWSECPVGRDGVVLLDDLVPVLQPETRIVSLMAVNNELGTRQPVQQVGALCRERGITFHTDACQAAGRLQLKPLLAEAAMATLCAHKVYGPRGGAALVVREGVTLRPLMGGGHQEGERRAGTENVSACVGLAKALQVAEEHHGEWVAHVRACEDALAVALQELGIELDETVPAAGRVPGIWNMAIEGLQAEEMLIGLDLEGIAISTGSACNSGSVRPSHVLSALGLAPDDARRRVRLSAGLASDPADMVVAVRAIAELLRRKRGGP